MSYGTQYSHRYHELHILSYVRSCGFNVWHIHSTCSLEAKDPDAEHPNAKDWNAKEVDANNLHTKD